MITKSAFFEMHEDGETHRKQFSAHSGIQKNKSSPTFSIPFDNGLGQHFTNKTGRPLRWNEAYKQHYCFLQNQDAIDEAESWEAAQGTRVFIRSLLNSAIALDFNFRDNQSREKTHFGQLEERAKHNQDADAITTIVDAFAETIDDVHHLSKADLICAVPALESKLFDLPRTLASELSARAEMADITPHMKLKGKEKSAKDCSMEQKWDTWSAADLSIEGFDVSGKKVILLDDKYQSGVTMHIIAACLFARGAAEIHGLVVVKTLRDTDNLNVV